MSSKIQDTAPLSPRTLQKIRDIQSGARCWSEDESSAWDTSDNETHISELTASPEIKREPARWTSSATASRPIVVITLSSNSSDNDAESVAPSADSAAEVFINYHRYPELRSRSLEEIQIEEVTMEASVAEEIIMSDVDIYNSADEVENSDEPTSPLISRYQHDSGQGLAIVVPAEGAPYLVPSTGTPYLDPSAAVPIDENNPTPASFQQISKFGQQAIYV